MAIIEDNKFQGMNHKLVDCHHVRKKDIVFVEEENKEPMLVEISDISSSKPGKHGSAKYSFIGTNLLTGKNRKLKVLSGEMVQLCTFVKNPCFLIKVDERNNEFMGFNEATCDDFRMPLNQVPQEALDKISALRVADPDVTIKFTYIDTPYFTSISDVSVDRS